VGGGGRLGVARYGNDFYRLTFFFFNFYKIIVDVIIYLQSVALQGRMSEPNQTYFALECMKISVVHSRL